MIDFGISELLGRGEIEAFRDSLARPSMRCIRLRPDRMDAEPLPTTMVEVPWYSQGRLLSDSDFRPSQSLGYAAADYYIQDAGSLLALALLDAKPDEFICDLCAAPGGKAGGILEIMTGGGFLLANEPIVSRVPLLRYSLSRTGQPQFAVTCQDPSQLAIRFEGKLNAVLVDAPCSGQAMVGKGKRDQNAYDPKQVAHSIRRQRRILLEASKLLKPDGRLIYSTCTFSIEENEAQIRFLRSHFPDCWEPIETSSLSAWSSPIEPGCYRLWPHRHPTSGAFVAGLRLVKPLASMNTEVVSRRRVPGRVVSRGSVPNELTSSDKKNLEKFGSFSGLRFAASSGLGFYGLTDEVPDRIVTRLNVSEWPKLFNIRSDEVKPGHGLGMMCPKWFQPHCRLDVSDSIAIAYMRGEAISFDEIARPGPRRVTWLGIQEASSLHRWTTITWRHKPLGWAKFAGNRFNNHLPLMAAIRIQSAE